MNITRPRTPRPRCRPATCRGSANCCQAVEGEWCGRRHGSHSRAASAADDQLHPHVTEPRQAPRVLAVDAHPHLDTRESSRRPGRIDDLGLRTCQPRAITCPCRRSLPPGQLHLGRLSTCTPVRRFRYTVPHHVHVARSASRERALVDPFAGHVVDLSTVPAIARAAATPAPPATARRWRAPADLRSATTRRPRSPRRRWPLLLGRPSAPRGHGQRGGAGQPVPRPTIFAPPG